MRRNDILKMSNSEMWTNDKQEKREEHKEHEEDKMHEKEMDENLTPITMLKDALTMFAIGVSFHGNASLCSHKLGLQGFKCLHKYYSHADEKYLSMIQDYCINVFDEIVMPDWSKIHMDEELKDTSNMLEEWYEHETEKYNYLNNIIKDLYDSEYAYEAKMITKTLEGAITEITKCKRFIQDFSKADWNWSYIGTKDHHLHKKIKEKLKNDYNYKIHIDKM